ncbi:MAG: hypothetical protein APR54_06360 [Candidatus Cloacimonas sp. SDB]|nr:MAG: hypothetical protein APR54_06360 [Candidatus Cloacimonas sp. SDB]
MKIYIVIALLFPISLISQEWINISPFTEYDNQVVGHFVSENEGWIRKHGMYISQEIYHTFDGGDNWEITYSLEDTLEYFVFFKMIDSINGWSTIKWRNNHYPYENYYSYQKTANGCSSWVDMTSYLPEENYDKTFYFIDQNVVFYGANCDPPDYNAKIYKTTDGGYNWYLTETPIIYYPDPYPVDYRVNSFFFLDENFGWASCSAAMDGGVSIYTTDGGETWNVGLEFGYPDIGEMQFTNQFYGGAISRNAYLSYLLITEDNFENVLYQYDSTDLNQTVYTLYFQDNSTIWVTGDPGIINRSTNGGETFEVFQEISPKLMKIQFVNDTGYIFGDDNNLLKLSNSSDIKNDTIINNCNLTVYPNPSNSFIYITFDNNSLNKVFLSIYNIKGQLVENLIDGSYTQNNQVTVWNGNSNFRNEISSGIYICKLKIANNYFIKKFIMLK